MKSLEQNKIYALTAYTIDNNPKETIALIRKNGVMIADNASSTQIEKAFAALLPKSEKFRNDFSKLILRTAQEDYSGFAATDLPSGKGLSTSDPSSSSKVFMTLGGTPPIEPPTGLTTRPKKSFSDTAVGSFLSGLFTPENASSAINTALNVWSVKQTGQPAVGVSNDLNSGRNELSSSGRGISTTTTVVLVVGALVLIGVAVYFYKKK